MKGERMANEIKEFHFRVEGNGVKVACAPVEARTEERAFKEALKQCKRFTLPGWLLVCEESGASMPVAQFFQPDGAGGITAIRA